MKKGSRFNLTSEFATREKVEFYERLYTSLPDPDKILQVNGYNYNIYRDLLTDPHLSAVIQQRKGQVLQMGWELENIDNEELKNEVLSIIGNWNKSKIGEDILDAVLYGFVPLEIAWEVRDARSEMRDARSEMRDARSERREVRGKMLDARNWMTDASTIPSMNSGLRLSTSRIVPIDLVGKPQEWFIFDKNNNLRLRKKNDYGYVYAEGEELPEYKFILVQNNPDYNNPYGEKLLSKVYWPVTFKRAGIEQWHLLTEKFGIPFLLGYYPDTATETDKNNLLSAIEEMVENNISIMKVGTQIEIKENPKYEIGGIFEKLCEFHNSEISKALLTVTLTTEIKGVGSYSAANIHKEMLEYIGIQDKKLIENAFNNVIRYYVDLNYGKDVESPTIKLTKKETIVDITAERDKILTEMGVKFSKGYFKKRYNLSDNDFELMDRIDPSSR